MHISDKARANVLDVLDNHRLTYGKWTKEFEFQFAALHARRFACMVNSGTDALRIGLAALKEKHGWPDGSEVIVPALTFVASVNVILQNNLRPLFVDIDDYYGIDTKHIAMILARREAAAESQPVAVMPVNLFGQVCDIDGLYIVRNFGLQIITDSCEAMFVRGAAWGDVSCFSTYACHVIQTGVGGIATTDNPQLAELIRSYANHGRDGIYAGIDEALGNVETMNARFRFIRPGYSSRSTEMEAAIGCAELEEHEANLYRRRAHAAALTIALAALPLKLPKVRPGAESSWMMYPIRCRSAEERDRLVLHLEVHGIETRPLLPLLTQPYLRKMYGDVAANYVRAYEAETTGFYVGCHPHMDAGDITYMAEAFHSFFRG